MEETTHCTPFALFHVLYGMWAQCAATDQAEGNNVIEAGANAGDATCMTCMVMSFRAEQHT
jgi:hypothetical protein